MSLNRSIGGLDEGDHYYFKVYKLVTCEARIILYHILNWACPRDLTQSFKTYAKDTLKMNSKRMKMFDNTMLKQMDENPSGNQFDVSLLNACIMAACPNYEELIIKPIKDFRNNIIHNVSVKDEAKMDELVQQLRDMLVNAVTKAGEVYKRPKVEINDVINTLDDNIKQIKECPLAVTDISAYKDNIANIRKTNKTIVCDKGVLSLKDSFKELSNVDPASWLSEKKGLNVKMVFTRLDIIAKNSDGDSCRSIGHEDLLCELQTEDGKKSPNIIVVEGEAGSGKSTLAKFILADWAGLDSSLTSPTINGLEKYAIVLYVECKNRYISSFLELLLISMPQVSYDMTDIDLVRSVLDLHTLVIIDGLDEMTENSEKLLKEMTGDCVRRSENRLHFLITTRPQKMKIILNICDSNSWVHTRITGIPPQRRVEFLERLHDEMIKSKQSEQDTSKLVDYMKHSQSRLGEHYRLPLNLTLLTYLWASDPEKVHNLTSATSLYDAVLEHLKLRVISRIQDALGSTKEIKDKVEKFTEVMFDVYLETHQSGSMQLTDKCQERLKIECKELELPFDDMCGAFFAVDRPNQWTYNDNGNQMYLSAPHKSIMEFFCAFKIFKCLIALNDHQKFAKELEALVKKYKHVNVPLQTKQNLSQVESDVKPKTLKDTVRNLLSEGKELHTIDFSHYQNVLLHLGGLMALKEKEKGTLQQYGPELVELLQLSKVAEAQWLDLVAEAECDPQFTSLVAQQISLKLVVRDGHTAAALEIFKDLETNLPLQIILENEVKYIPKIEDLMEELSKRDCSVELLLKNHWKNPQNGTSTELLQKLFEKKCYVTRFTGNLTNLKILPVDVTNLRVTIADDSQAQLICDDIAALKSQLDLEYFGIHVMKSVSPGLLKPLPVVKPGKKECGSLWISGVEDNDDVSRVCDIAVALLPEKMKFQSILFPRCSLSQTRFKDLLEQLKVKGVTVSMKGGVKTDSLLLQKEDVINVRTFTKKALGCEFYCGDESSVW